MAVNVKNYDNYGDIKHRLDDIAASVEDENVSLDDALDLYDEAVKLAMRASELVEVDAPVSASVDAPEETTGGLGAVVAATPSDGLE